MHNEAISGGIMFVDMQREEVVLIPNALRIDNYAAGSNLIFEVAAQALDIFGRWFDGDHGFGPGIERLLNEHANIGSAVQNYIPGTNEVLPGAIDLTFLLGQVERKNVAAACGDPERPFRRFPLL